MANPPRSVELSVRIYELLVKAYPASFRRRYGDEMTRVFRELATDALRQRGAFGLMTAWFRVLGDLAWTAPQEHLVELQRRIEMKTSAFAVFSVVVAAIVYLLVFAAVGILYLCVLLGLSLLTTGTFFSSDLLVACASPVREFALLYVPAFLTGMILIRAKPFFMPMVTAPLGTMAFLGLVCCQDVGPAGWGALAVRVGFVASAGLVSLLGCIVATKVSSYLGKPCAN